MDRRFQIFVSSTFQDLPAERAAITKVILDLGQFPAGMELFAADNRPPWDVITKVIDDSDYYVLVIAGRYGSVDESGASYTEREYDYAVLHDKHILAFVHEAPGEIAFDRNEQNPEMRERLASFRKKVMDRHTVKGWRTCDELCGHVSSSLALAMVRTPGIGWVRGNRIASEDALEKVVRLQESLKETTEQLEAQREMLLTIKPSAEDRFASMSQEEASFLVALSNEDHLGTTTLEHFTADPSPQMRWQYEKLLEWERQGLLDQSGYDSTFRITLYGWKIVDMLRERQLLQILCECPRESCAPGELRSSIRISEKDFVTLVNRLESSGLVRKYYGGPERYVRCTAEGRVLAERTPFQLTQNERAAVSD